MTVHTLLSAIRELFQDTLGANLTGCYLHGSLALGCFQWRRSDVDFLAVVDEEPGPAQKESLISGLLGLEPLAPPKGMEMSLVCRDACLPFRYPTPYVLHYSRMHQAAARRDTAAYCEAMHGLDKDLAWCYAARPLEKSSRRFRSHAIWTACWRTLARTPLWTRTPLIRC